MRRALLGALCVACALITACSSDTEPLTQIVVVVDSDWAAIDRFELDVDGIGGGEVYDTPVDVIGFPRTLALVHDGGPLGPISVTVRAFEDGNPTALLVERRRDIHFERDRTRLLRIDLLAACAKERCDEACIDDDGPMCVSAEEAAKLTDWTGSIDPLGVSVTSPPGDAGLDGAVEDMDAGDGGQLDLDATSGTDAAGGTDAGDAGEPVDACSDTGVDAGPPACTTTCAFTTATPNAAAAIACVGDTCIPSCDPGFVDCDGDYENGCEGAVADSCGCPGLPAKRKPLTVDGTKVSGSLSAFPLLVSFADTDLAAGAASDGADLCFTEADGVTRLPFELERYTSATGAVVAWVAMPALDDGVSTGLYLYYGDGTTTSRATPAQVWDASYAGVYHFDADARDSTGNANAGSVTGAVVGGPGRLGGAASFAGATDVISLGSPSSLDNVFSGGGSIEAWVQPTSWGGGGLGRLLDKATSNGAAGGWNLEVAESSPAGGLTFVHDFNVGNATWSSPDASLALATWRHVAVTYTKGQLGTPTVYVDGAAVALSGGISGSFGISDDGSATLRIGNSAAGDRAFDGLIDEVRVSNATRSADWLATSFANQSDPATFVAVGAEESYP